MYDEQENQKVIDEAAKTMKVQPNVDNDIDYQDYHLRKNVEKNLRFQQKSLESFEKYESQRAQFMNISTRMTNKQPSQSLLKISDGFRKVQESKNLCDLGDTIVEKYGQQEGWKLTLRHHQIEINANSRNEGNVSKS